MLCQMGFEGLPDKFAMRGVIRHNNHPSPQWVRNKRALGGDLKIFERFGERAWTSLAEVSQNSDAQCISPLILVLVGVCERYPLKGTQDYRNRHETIENTGSREFFWLDIFQAQPDNHGDMADNTFLYADLQQEFLTSSIHVNYPLAMGAQMGFMLALRLTRQIKASEISIRDLPYDSLRERDVAMIMRGHGHLYQQLPRQLKTQTVLKSAILSKSDAVRTVGCNITDDLACLAIDKWGRSAFMVMGDRNKTQAVAMHAIRNMAIAYKDIKKEKRTQEMSDLAFDLNHGLIYEIPDAHLTTKMLLACIPAIELNDRIKWPRHLVTPEAVELITNKGRSYIPLIPDNLLTPEVLAKCASDDPYRIGRVDNAMIAIHAIRYSIEVMSPATQVTRDFIKNVEAQVGQGQLSAFIFGNPKKSVKNPNPMSPGVQQIIQSLLGGVPIPQIKPEKPTEPNKVGLYALLYRINADDPAALAMHTEFQHLLPDLMAVLHGGRVAAKFFPKSPNRGRWLEQELGM